MRDYYEILDISEDASQAEIKSSYRKLAKKYHPDLNQGDEEAQERFKEINQAYEVLGDQEKRQMYDRFGPDGVNGGAGQGFGGFEDIFGDFFGDIFGGGFNQNRKPYTGPTIGEDLRYNLEIDFMDAVFGKEEEVTLRRSETCKTCEGSGAKPGTEKKTCGNCQGTGEVKNIQRGPFGQMVRVSTCDVCNGTGEIIEEKCTDCSGQGKNTVTRTIKVKIPKGVDNGSIISIRGEGEAGNRGGASGDLYIYIYVREHELFKRTGDDIHYTLPISFVDAALGASIEVVGLDEIIIYDIPKGTKTNTTFKIKGKGVENVRGHGKGDLYFTVEVEVPTELTDRQIELLEEFGQESKTYHKKEKKGFFEKMKEAFKN